MAEIAGLIPFWKLMRNCNMSVVVIMFRCTRSICEFVSLHTFAEHSFEKVHGLLPFVRHAVVVDGKAIEHSIISNNGFVS